MDLQYRSNFHILIRLLSNDKLWKEYQESSLHLLTVLIDFWLEPVRNFRGVFPKFIV
jgi:hypothetical protein